MAFNYGTNLDAVINVLKNSNTTTSSPDLSGGLTTRIDSDNIFKADVETVGIKNYNFPQIFVRISNKTEDFAGLGNTGLSNSRKSAEVIYDVVGLYKKEGAWSKHDDLLTDVYKMADNIESVLRQNITLSNTALWCQPQTTDFLDPVSGDKGIWVKGFMMTFKAMYHFQ